MSTIAATKGRGRSFQGKHLLFLVFGLMALYVIYTRDLSLLDANSPLRLRYAKIPWLILAHGVFGALALVIAPFQFSTRIRQRYLQLHRIMGRLYGISVLISAPAAVLVAMKLGPPVLLMATYVQGFGWLATTATAIYCVRNGMIQHHREWMMRSYPFAAVFVVVRVIITIPAIERLGELGLVAVVWSTIAVACLLPSLIIAWRGVATAKRAKTRATAAA